MTAFIVYYGRGEEARITAADTMEGISKAAADFLGINTARCVYEKIITKYLSNGKAIHFVTIQHKVGVKFLCESFVIEEI